ncbi:uncharacterized protein A1O5_02918 [Cladophialophora psammophila CBS 110553]|uniref:Major facilitator superfamily (MFS) profile domain-containing protein n=1 Tax=Cladophialophora psammophila CBS 110553 TaxID=1182543 RepID=W9XCF6_9EURO|nr:uncharacterized protein A1O5_02918 [Cladophialophora psammophila CBS 110553]EXJ74621.1 hypothetical protein A1O5_02918 [Cladophialophora psammophila CBS 110553]
MAPTDHRAKATRYNFAVAFYVALGSFTYGFHSAIIGSVIGMPSFYSYFDFVATSSYGGSIIGACNGLYAGAGVLGCWAVFWFADKFGRKIAIQIIAAICIISAAIQAGSVHIAMFLVGRMLNGFGVGMINCAIPTYISEISPAAQRGLVVGSHGFIICCSYTLMDTYAMAGWAEFGIYYANNPTIQWRLLVALQIVAPLLLLIGSPLIPESPRWLIENGRGQESLEILIRLHKNKLDPDDIGAREEFVQIQRQLALEHSNKVPGLFKTFTIPSYRKRLFYGFFLQAMCQSMGVLVISNYMVTTLENLGLSGSTPLLVLAFYNSWAAVLNYINARNLDRFGRVRIVTTAVAGAILCVCIVTALVANYGGPTNTNKAGSGAAVAFIFLFVTCYGLGVDVTSYVYCAEIFPTHMRTRGVGFSVGGLFLMTTVYTTAAGPAFNHIGWRFYLVFIIVTSLMLPFVILYFPETKGLSLEEIDVLFGDEVALDLTHLSEEERAAFDKNITEGLNVTYRDMEKGALLKTESIQVIDGSEEEGSVKKP